MADENDNSLTCEECGKNFVSKKNLLSHKKTHSNERPHKCVDCGQTFSLRNTLVCHRRVHTKERPYTCTLCFKSFTQASTLKAHVIYKHTKSFPYSCDKCGRGFISPGQKVDHYSQLRDNTPETQEDMFKEGHSNHQEERLFHPGQINQIGEPNVRTQPD
ncbi:gastrula zinc finger protein XlCGF49.1-like [Centruroides sculpturatus]|uniref:gastrula zinc finger protein XlCGF49.1-like n=1 Tax=Centruroides sculpturatus TaxID=218467 RepID=UPI000C6E1FE5|nr:gastrula zinc finger protein XlCGF49.1-like [Centruroides sculpturatus]